MLITLLGLAFIVVATVIAYRTAKQYERNPVMWALCVLGTGLGIQILTPNLIALIIVIFMVRNGNSVLEIQTALMISIIFSIAAMLLILRHLAKLPDENIDMPPAPPSYFS